MGSDEDFSRGALKNGANYKNVWTATVIESDLALGATTSSSIVIARLTVFLTICTPELLSKEAMEHVCPCVQEVCWKPRAIRFRIALVRPDPGQHEDGYVRLGRRKCSRKCTSRSFSLVRLPARSATEILHGPAVIPKVVSEHTPLSQVDAPHPQVSAVPVLHEVSAR